MERLDEQTRRFSSNQNIHINPNSVNALCAKLSADDAMERAKARHCLVAIGSPAVGRLIELLEAPYKQEVRWEAAKALAGIADPAAAEVLVRALEDKVFDVRWLAAIGLIKLRRAGVVPLLKALVEHSDSPWLRNGAHHVLFALAVRDSYFKELFHPIINSLEDAESAIVTPLVARGLLDRLASEQPVNP
jgi:HEAT repeat protein